MLTVSPRKRLLSFFTPVLLQSASSGVHPVLDLHLYKGQLQLSTTDALYSDLRRYRPLAKSLPRLRKAFPRMQQVLMLGTGLAAGVHLLHQYGVHPQYTLVDLDSSILQLAAHYLPPQTDARLVCADAQSFLLENTRRYDLLILDIFLGQQVPDYVHTPAFLSHCYDTLTPGGYFIFNFIRNERSRFLELAALVQATFPKTSAIEYGLNHVFICQKEQ